MAFTRCIGSDTTDPPDPVTVCLLQNLFKMTGMSAIDHVMRGIANGLLIHFLYGIGQAFSTWQVAIGLEKFFDNTVNGGLWRIISYEMSGELGGNESRSRRMFR